MAGRSERAEAHATPRYGGERKRKRSHQQLQVARPNQSGTEPNKARCASDPDPPYTTHTITPHPKPKRASKASASAGTHAQSHTRAALCRGPSRPAIHLSLPSIHPLSTDTPPRVHVASVSPVTCDYVRPYGSIRLRSLRLHSTTTRRRSPRSYACPPHHSTLSLSPAPVRSDTLTLYSRRERPPIGILPLAPFTTTTTPIFTQYYAITAHIALLVVTDASKGTK